MTAPRFTTYPHVPRPLLLHASSAAVAGMAVIAALEHAYPFAAWFVVLSALPWGSSERQRRLGYDMALGTLGWVLLGLFPTLDGLALQGPYGGPPYVFALGGLTGVFRALSLARESVVRFTSARFQIGETAPVEPTSIALPRALRAGPEAEEQALEAAVVALAAMPEHEIGEAEHERRAFWINTYNVLARHASRGRRSAAADDVFEIYRTRYAVSGLYLSLNAIEHGLLRGNRPMPGWPFRLLRGSDPRLRWLVPLDARVHFALNCGARSCPPIRVYHAETLDDELALAQESFLAAETELDVTSGVLTTSALLRFYEPDFGGPSGVAALLACVLQRPEALRLQIRHRRYDWRALSW